MATDKACIVGVYEHPLRLATGLSLAQLHAEVAWGALRDAGLGIHDVDGYFCAGDVAGGDASGCGAFAMVEYLGLRLRHLDTTEVWGAAYLAHVAHAADAIAAGRCDIALVTMAGRPRAEGTATGTTLRPWGTSAPHNAFEVPFRPTIVGMYGMCAARHMHEFGTTSEQLAWVKVAASHHAQHNPNAMLRQVVTVDDVLSSPLIASPLHRLDCCVISDGGGALVLARPDIARTLGRPLVSVRGSGLGIKHQRGGDIDLTHSAARWSGRRAFQEAGVSPGDIKYASIYDSFTISVIVQLEDLGFCKKGQGGRFVADGNLIAGTGRLAVNTDGGGLCNNHPGNRGGMTKVIEAVRQLRGEAHPAVQVGHCDLALASGIGGHLGSRHGAATLILERT